MAPERRSNAAGPDTETSVQKGWSGRTNDAGTGEWPAMLERDRDRQGEREGEGAGERRGELIRADCLIIV